MQAIPTFAFLAALAFAAQAADEKERAVPKGPQKPAPFKPVAAEVAKAWADQGGRLGWMEPDDWDSMSYDSQAGDAGPLPVFMFQRWEVGRAAKLPPVGQPFAIFFLGAYVSNEMVKDICAIGNLQALSLGFTELCDDDGLDNVAKLEKLQNLDVSGTKVTDAGLKKLVKLKNLKVLDVTKTEVTAAGIAELKKALPKLRVKRMDP